MYDIPNPEDAENPEATVFQLPNISQTPEELLDTRCYKNVEGRSRETGRKFIQSGSVVLSGYGRSDTHVTVPSMGHLQSLNKEQTKYWMFSLCNVDVIVTDRNQPNAACIRRNMASKVTTHY